MILRWAILVCVLTISTFAQAAADSTEKKVDIRQLVEKQISDAKDKEGVLEANAQKTMTGKDGTINDIDILNLSSFETKLIILSGFSSIVLLVVGFRRLKKKKFSAKNTPAEHYNKKNIQLMREEKFIRPIDPRLKKIRTNLYLNTRYLNNSNSNLSDAAKKLNIAKTELMLAARFNRKFEENEQKLVGKQHNISTN